MPGTVLGAEDSRHLRWDSAQVRSQRQELKQQHTVRGSDRYIQEAMGTQGKGHPDCAQTI